MIAAARVTASVHLIAGFQTAGVPAEFNQGGEASRQSETWYECNDASVKVIPQDLVQSEDAYLLVYQRRK